MLVPAVTTLHQQGVNLHSYIDDFLNRESRRLACLHHTQQTVDLLTKLGWHINLDLSSLTPSHKGLMFPTADRYHIHLAVEE